jgi:hypothetical protein
LPRRVDVTETIGIAPFGLAAAVVVTGGAAALPRHAVLLRTLLASATLGTEFAIAAA